MTRTLTAAAVFLGVLASACEAEQRTAAPVTRTLPPGVKEVTETPALPTVVPATPTATPGTIEATKLVDADDQVTLPVTAGTFLRVVETCFWEECWGYALPPGTPVVAPTDGKVTIEPSAPDTVCSIVVAIYRSTDSQKGKLTDPPGTVELAGACDSDLAVETGDTVKRGDLVMKLGQRGIYEGRGDAPPTVLRFTCQYLAKACNWAGGTPHFYRPPPELTPTKTPNGEPGETATPTPEG